MGLPLHPNVAYFALALSLFGVVGCSSLSESVELDGKSPSKFKGGNNSVSHVPKDWWKLFRDSELSSLVGRIEDENLQLRAGMARIDQAYAVLGISRADLVPNLAGSGAAKRNRSSENDLGGDFFPNLTNQYDGALAAGWEIDLWGRVRNAVRGAKADAEQVERLTDDLRLSLQSQLARNYFALRFLDREMQVLRQAVASREANLQLATDRFEGELTSELDVSRAETELSATKADLVRLKGPRTRLENAIAVLVGEAPSGFTVRVLASEPKLPTVRPGVPLSVLENRPDVAAAISRLDSTSAQIGVAKAEFLPRFELIGSGGLSSVSSTDFFDWSSRTFSVGPEVTLPVFQGGRLKANLKGARAAQEEALANYQQTVLDALREVDDALADLAALRAELEAQGLAVRASNRALEISEKRYKEGLVNSIDVVDALREKLNADRRVVQIRGQQFDATVNLIQAMGGGMTKEMTK